MTSSFPTLPSHPGSGEPGGRLPVKTQPLGCAEGSHSSTHSAGCVLPASRPPSSCINSSEHFPQSPSSVPTPLPHRGSPKVRWMPKERQTLAPFPPRVRSFHLSTFHGGSSASHSEFSMESRLRVLSVTAPAALPLLRSLLSSLPPADPPRQPLTWDPEKQQSQS